MFSVYKAEKILHEEQNQSLERIKEQQRIVTQKSIKSKDFTDLFIFREK